MPGGAEPERRLRERAEPRVGGLVESALYVGDVDRARSFYRDVLGLDPLTETPDFAAFAVAPGQVLLLFRRGSMTSASETAGGTIPPHDGRGELHLAFAITPADLAPWEERLRSRGIAIESRVRWGRGGESIYFRDPDNHLVELATPGVWENY